MCKNRKTRTNMSIMSNTLFIFLSVTHRKTPQSMFRPLLSSVPASTFYVGNTNSIHQPIFSTNSSLTTSSNASSEHGASVAPDLEDDDHDQSDLAGEWEKKKSEFQEEVFCFDTLDGICEDTGHDTCSSNLLSCGEIFDGSTVNEVDSKSKLECSTVDDGDAVNTAVACRVLLYAAEFVEIDSAEKMSICSKCGKKIMATDKDVDVDICQECSATYRLIGSEEPGTFQVGMHDDENGTLDHKVLTQMGIPVLSDSTSEIRPIQHKQSSEQVVTAFSSDCGLFPLVSDKKEQNLSELEVCKLDELSVSESSSKYESQKIISEQEVLVSSEVNAPESSGECEPLKLQPTPSPSDMFDKSEGTELEAPIAIPDSSFIEDNCVLSDTGCQDDVNGVATHSSSIVISDQQIDTLTFQNSQIYHAPVQQQDSAEDFQESCLSVSHKDVLLSELESKTAEDPSSEEPKMMIEAPRKHMQRSFTLEEATNTILFCSYIVHDMAYKAATIGMEKELATYESSHRTVTYLGSSVSNQKNLQKKVQQTNSDFIKR